MADEGRKLTRLETLRGLINGNASGLDGLNTTNKTDLVSAINELLSGTGSLVNDNVESAITVWSSLMTSYKISTAIADLISTSPETLDTLNELAEALGNDPNFATTMTNLISTKAPIHNPIFTGVVTLPSGSIPDPVLPPASTTVAGVVERATLAEVSEGVDTTRYVTPSTLRSEISRLEALISG